jgi:hypothetical protein
MTTRWKAPTGFKLTRHDGYQLNDRGQRISDATRDDRRNPMPDGAILVVHYNDAEPFYPDTHANGESGWSPNATLEPIKDGQVPPAYTLELKEKK